MVYLLMVVFQKNKPIFVGDSGYVQWPPKITAKDLPPTPLRAPAGPCEWVTFWFISAKRQWQPEGAGREHGGSMLSCTAQPAAWLAAIPVRAVASTTALAAVLRPRHHAHA